jgi:hypothetical protein
MQGPPMSAQGFDNLYKIANGMLQQYSAKRLLRLGVMQRNILRVSSPQALQLQNEEHTQRYGLLNERRNRLLYSSFKIAQTIDRSVPEPLIPRLNQLSNAEFIRAKGPLLVTRCLKSRPESWESISGSFKTFFPMKRKL